MTFNEETRGQFRAAWRLTRPYWVSEQKWSGWGLLLAVTALDLGNVYVSVLLNKWNNDFYNALQNLNSAVFFRQIGIFCLLAAASIVMSVYAVYLQQMLQIRWRRWLTDRYLGAWLADQAYYRLQLQGNPTDNPDQRISEDLNSFTSYVLSLSLGLLTSIVSLFSFLFILWGLSGPATIPLGGWGSISIPAYLVWAALLYAGFGTWLTMRVGAPLISLNFAQQRLEADFRFSLMRLRENAESVALFRGEHAELHMFKGRFASVFDNFWAIMKRQKLLSFFTVGYSQVAVIFPVVVVAPRFFAKQIQLGGLMQVVSAFNSVQSSLSFVINSYTDIATWLAVTQRLSGFANRLDVIAASVQAPQEISLRRAGEGVAVAHLDLALPDATPLMHGIDFTVAPGESVIVSGPTGIGKSTLIRALAGIWPFGKGEIRVAAGSTLFVPQRPYLPLGTLADVLRYPGAQGHVPKDRLAKLLVDFELPELVGQLDTFDNWSHRLSLGEQQRLSFARIMLIEPEIVFLDEATSALDEPCEGRCYRKLRAASWHPTIVSVGHRSTLRLYHDRVIDVADFACPERGDLPPELTGVADADPILSRAAGAE
ncbi:MAG TPA: ABC transporter ATP-binding protein/permease [Stellaceae bacterium]|nr:ABC transporter ATP-binding protein/permease [Stellaceae bacterium]